MLFRGPTITIYFRSYVSAHFYTQNRTRCWFNFRCSIFDLKEEEKKGKKMIIPGLDVRVVNFISDPSYHQCGLIGAHSSSRLAQPWVSEGRGSSQFANFLSQFLDPCVFLMKSVENSLKGWRFPPKARFISWALIRTCPALSDLNIYL